MTYSENLEKLRQAGVIDITLSFGCELKYGYETKTEAERRTGKIIGYITDGYRVIYENTIMFVYKYEILGHPLTIGRVLWWIEKTITGTYWQEEPKKQLDNLRHNKDLPLDDQENKEEIAEFLVGLIE